jgi:hypothetical protein
VNYELEMIWKEAVLDLILMHHSGIRLEGMRKAMNNFDQDNWSPCRDLYL